jgi:hypothetical protein
VDAFLERSQYAGFNGHTKALWPGYLPPTFAASVFQADFAEDLKRFDVPTLGLPADEWTKRDEGLGTQLTRTGKDCVHNLERLAVSPGDRVQPEDPWQSAGRLLLETD